MGIPPQLPSSSATLRTIEARRSATTPLTPAASSRSSSVRSRAARANRLAFALHAHLARAAVTAAGPDLRGVLRHLIVRTTRNDRAVAMLVVTRNDKSLRAPVRAFLATEEAPDGFYLNIHDKPGPFMVGRETMRLAGRSHIRESVARVVPGVTNDVFQTNVEGAEVLVRLALDAMPDQSRKILDLYAGSGLFTLSFAKRGHQVTAIEENVQAMRDAEASLRLNRIPEATVRLQIGRVEGGPPAERVAKRLASSFSIRLDPGPSAGVVRAVFNRIRAPRVLYVSCNPEALAAELPLI